VVTGGRVAGRAASQRLALARAVLVWTAAGLIGGSVFRALGGPARTGVGEAATWLVAVAAAVLVGVVAGLVAQRGRPPDAVAQRCTVAAVGWGVANSAGWTLGVNVGGVATGLAVATALVAGISTLRSVAAGLGGLLGLAAQPALAGVVPAAVGPLSALVCGTAGFVVGLAAGSRRVSVRPGPVGPVPVRAVAALAAVWAVAWVGAWFLTTRLLSAYPVPLAVGVETVGALGVGGAGTALLWRRASGEPVRAVVLRWVLAGTGGLAAAWCVAWAVWTVASDPSTAVDGWLDVGTTLTLPIAAWLALRPTVAAVQARVPGTPTP